MSDDHEHEHAEREHEHDEPEHEHHELEHDAGGSAAPDSEAAGPGAFGLEESERAHREAEEQHYFVAETSEGAQELLPRGTTSADELRSEVGARAGTSIRATSTLNAATTRP